MLGMTRSTVENVVHSYYSALTTTSPNSILLASLDASITYFQNEGKTVIEKTANLVSLMKKRLSANPRIRLLESSDLLLKRNWSVDPLKVSLQFVDDNGVVKNCEMIDDDLCKSDFPNRCVFLNLSYL
jgi:arginine/lysine/ornithine decarboxylase